MKPVNANEKLADRLALSPTELAAATGIGRNTVYAAIASGELKAKKIGQRKFVVMIEEIIRWLNEN
jgi:excisionase family DNA binding protein